LAIVNSVPAFTDAAENDELWIVNAAGAPLPELPELLLLSLLHAAKKNANKHAVAMASRPRVVFMVAPFGCS
jgi:hypothetical protein